MAIFNEKAANDNTSRDRRDDWIERLIRASEPSLRSGLTFGELEEELLSVSNELVRRVLEQTLQELSDGYAEQIMVTLPSEKGTSNVTAQYRRHEVGTARYYSLCGPLDIARATYRLVGTRNGPTIVPVELQAGLIARATPALAYALAQGHAKEPIRSVEQDLHSAHRHPPSRSTMDRIAREIGLSVHAVVPVIEPALRAREELPAGAHAVNIGLDRTTVPMEEPLHDKVVERPAVMKPQITVRYRMAYVGTVCVTNQDGEVLCGWRYAAPAHEGPAEVLGRMVADVNRALDQKPRLKLGVVQDGAAEMWNLVREALRENPQTKKRKWRETVDRYHFMERVAALLECFYPDASEQPKRRELLDRWRREIDTSDRAPKAIHDWFEKEALRLDREEKKKRFMWLRFDEKLGCYMIRQDHFHYASLADDGLHSGSGVTEGACKFLIAARAKRSGQRWTKRGITAVLALRSLLASERLDRFWRLFAPRYQAMCLNAA